MVATNLSIDSLSNMLGLYFSICHSKGSAHAIQPTYRSHQRCLQILPYGGHAGDGVIGSQLRFSTGGLCVNYGS